jgi:carbamoyltransferase
MSKILGISAFYHDSAAALIIDGDIVGAAQEERFSRIKHDPSYPSKSINYLFEKYNLTYDDLDYVVFYEKPFLKFERLIETYISNAPFGFKQFSKAMPIWLREKLFLKNQLLKQIKKKSKNFSSKNILFSNHHYSHAASAFYPSPFKNSLILTLDGVGEWASTTIGYGSDGDIKLIKEICFPHSLGLLYTAFTYYTGFKVNSGEYKLMGLAPYGNPHYVDKIFKYLIDLKDDGSFRLNQNFFNYSTGLTMINNKFEKLFGQPTRKNENSQITQFHMDIAASIQKVTEIVILKIAKYLSLNYDFDNLCLAGGVALNCVANGKLLKSKYFKNIWIQPAAGDAGGALGAALLVYYKFLKNKRVVNQNDSMKGAYLGPEYSQKSIKNSLNKLNAKYITYTQSEMIKKTSNYLSEGKAIGWFQGRMEFGPRALGARSIIADARSKNIQKDLNLKVKFRESFRPFAPAILREELSNWFDINIDSPYMLLVDEIKKNKQKEMKEHEKKLFGIDKLNVVRSVVPSITHVDYSSRIQTVHKNTNPIFHNLLMEFKNKTDCPILVNTSFNVRGEPIVNTIEDAYRCFMGTNLDVLVVGNSILLKEDQNLSDKISYEDKYELD